MPVAVVVSDSADGRPLLPPVNANPPVPPSLTLAMVIEGTRTLVKVQLKAVPAVALPVM